jgi:hypothetical protein
MNRLRGGCYCGRIRYEVVSVFDATYCHCSICRRVSGAPVYAGLVTPAGDFRVVSGEPRSFASSDHGTRWFCAECGTHLYCTDAHNDRVSVALGTLDDPNVVSPRIHQWTSEQLAWFQIADDLPRVEDGTLPRPAKRAPEEGPRRPVPTK